MYSTKVTTSFLLSALLKRHIFYVEGRDSVLAQHRPPELQQAGDSKLMNREELDNDLTRRLNVQFGLEKKPYDIKGLKQALLNKDKHKQGRLSRAEVNYKTIRMHRV